MSSALVKIAAKQLLGSEMKKYQHKQVCGANDPYFTKVIDPRSGKEKKVKKHVPDYIPDHDAMILAKMRRRSYRLDMSLFNFAGIRFGWSSVIGFIPAAGDAADAALALLLVWRCSKIKCGLGNVALITMLVNVLIDFIIGIVPILGDLLDAAFKANTRNVRVLEKRLDEAYKPDGLKAKDQEYHSNIKTERRKSGMRYEAEYEAQPATVIEEFSEAEEAEMNANPANGAAAASLSSPTANQRPKRASWLGRRPAQADVERGVKSNHQPVQG